MDHLNRMRNDGTAIPLPPATNIPHELGKLWYDANCDTELERVLKEACDYYYRKFGKRPTVAYVNPADLKAWASAHRDPLTYKMPCRVRPGRSIIPHHVWVGMDLNGEYGGALNDFAIVLLMLVAVVSILVLFLDAIGVPTLHHALAQLAAQAVALAW